MKIFDELLVTVAEPFSYSRDIGNGKREYWNSVFEMNGKKFISKINPMKGSFDDYRFYDNNNLVNVYSFSQIIDHIKNNELTKKRCTALRIKGIPEDHQKYIKMCGLFRMRFGTFEMKKNSKGHLKFVDDGLLEHPGVICFDIDKLDEEGLKYIKQSVDNDQYTLFGFISPRGNGYKWLVRIPPIINDHEAYYKSLIEYYEEKWLGVFKIDGACKNESRICFLSHDQHPYINEESKLWTKKKEIEKSFLQKEIIYKKSIDRDFKIAVDRVETGRRGVNDKTQPIFFVDGSRHSYILAVGGMCKGFGMNIEEFRSVGGHLFVDKHAEELIAQIFKIK